MTDHHQSAPPRDAAKQVRMVQLDPATRGALADGDLVADGAAGDVLAASPAFAPQVAKVLAPAPWLTVA